ncbi:VacJ family lipoprotein [Fusobacterium sp.]|uniref:MlaA family lipoprotein n=1 Tax=Fusobacterium sp. TaxID=68766 RepID=UPI00396C36DB
MKIKKYIFLFLLLFSFLTFADTANEVVQEEKGMEYFNVYDPLEPLNRRIYYFNYQFDKFIFLPTIKIYKTITPAFVRKGVNNFFQNTKNISTAGNAVAQFKIKKAMRTLGRFTMNIAFGFGGVYNAADDFGIPKPYEDFGLTLAHYGIEKGPYLVLPILGPSNFRDALGVGVDTLINRGVYNKTYLPSMNDNEITVLQAVNKRDHVSFQYYETGSPFEYEYVRFLYQKYRKLQTDIGTEVF